MSGPRATARVRHSARIASRSGSRSFAVSSGAMRSGRLLRSPRSLVGAACATYILLDLHRPLDDPKRLHIIIVETNGIEPSTSCLQSTLTIVRRVVQSIVQSIDECSLVTPRSSCFHWPAGAQTSGPTLVHMHTCRSVLTCPKATRCRRRLRLWLRRIRPLTSRPPTHARPRRQRQTQDQTPPRGHVVEVVTGPQARTNIDVLAQKYLGTDYSDELIHSERVLLKIAPDSQIVFAGGMHDIRR